MVTRQLITYIDKLHPDTEQISMLITQMFVLGGNRTHDLWLSSQGLEQLDQQASQNEVIQ